MGKTAVGGTDLGDRQQSMILVEPTNQGVTIERNLRVFGYDDPEGRAVVNFEDARVPASNLIGNEGQGFGGRRRGGSVPAAASIRACARSASPSGRWS